MSTHFKLLSQQFSHLLFEQNKQLASYTTVKIGGPAEIFCEVKSSTDLIELCKFAYTQQIPVTILGWGANTLISDNGISGLVIKNSSQEVKILDEAPLNIELDDQVSHRWQKEEVGTEYYDFSDLDFIDDNNAKKVLVEISSGASLPMLINSLLNQGITGLQWFARIPASLGGAIYNNIHGGTRFISEYIYTVTVLNEDGAIVTLQNNELEFGYDYSRFHRTSEIILSAQLLLSYGDVSKAKQTAIEWAIRKKIQPQNSLGCIFQNLTEDQTKQAGISNPAAGYLIDQVLKLKGHQIGQAKISEKHAAFIENLGGATAQDYLALIRLVQQTAVQKIGFKFKPEIFFLGFKPEEIRDIM